jgi:hypothetical protein
MQTWNVYGAHDADGDTELLGAILAGNIYEAIDKANEKFGDCFIDEITLFTGDNHVLH